MQLFANIKKLNFYCYNFFLFLFGVAVVGIVDAHSVAALCLIVEAQAV